MLSSYRVCHSDGVYRSQWVPTSVPTEVEPTDEVRAIGPCDDRDDLPLHRLAHRHDDSPMPPSFRSAVQPIAFDGLSQASVGVPYSADGRPRALGQRVDILRPPRADRAARDVSTARATFRHPMCNARAQAPFYDYPGRSRARAEAQWDEYLLVRGELGPEARRRPRGAAGRACVG